MDGNHHRRRGRGRGRTRPPSQASSNSNNSFINPRDQQWAATGPGMPNAYSPDPALHPNVPHLPNLPTFQGNGSTIQFNYYGSSAPTTQQQQQQQQPQRQHQQHQQQRQLPQHGMMLPPPPSSVRSRSGRRRRTDSRYRLDVNDTPLGPLPIRMPTVGRVETQEPSESGASIKREFESMKDIDEVATISPGDSSPNTGRNNKRSKHRVQASECVACHDPGHRLGKHPYANTEVGYLLGCIIHNTYSHTLAQCNVWAAEDRLSKYRKALEDRPSMAPVYIAGTLPTDILKDAQAETRRPITWTREAGPYTPGFMKMLNSDDLSPSVRQQLEAGRRINPPSEANDYLNWSGSQVRDPLAEVMYEGIINWSLPDATWEASELARLQALAQRGEATGIVPPQPVPPCPQAPPPVAPVLAPETAPASSQPSIKVEDVSEANAAVYEQSTRANMVKQEAGSRRQTAISASRLFRQQLAQSIRATPADLIDITKLRPRTRTRTRDQPVPASESTPVQLVLTKELNQSMQNSLNLNAPPRDPSVPVNNGQVSVVDNQPCSQCGKLGQVHEAQRCEDCVVAAPLW